MVFENLVVYLLDKYLGDYIENLDTKKLKIDLWTGNVVLENLYLKPNALADLNLLVRISVGYLQKLVLEVPWKNLYTNPTKATIDGLYLLVVPETEVEYDAKRDAKEQHETKMKEVQKVEELRKEKEAAKDGKDADKNSDTFAERMQLQVIRNLELSIQNVHIVYEDRSTKPNHPFAMGITLNYIKFHTTSPDWKPTILKEDTPLIHKLGELSALSIYWNTDAQSRSGLPRDTVIKNLQEKIATNSKTAPIDISYILRPLNVQARVKLVMKPRKEEYKQPMFHIEVDLDEISLNINRDQYLDVLDLLEFQDYLSTKSRFIKYQIKDQQIKASRKNWKFAYEAIVNEDVRPRFDCYKWENIKAHSNRRREYRKIHLQSLTGKLTEEQKQRAEELEKKLDVFNLTWMRREAEIEAKEKKEREPKGLIGSISSWWSGSKPKDDPELDLEKVMSPDEKQKLYDAIGYEGDDTSKLSYPETYIDIDLTIGLKMLDVNVWSKINENDTQNRIVTRATIPNTGLIFRRRPASDAIAVFVDLGSFQVFGIATDLKSLELSNTSRPILAQPVVPPVGSGQNSLLHIEFETNPIGLPIDYRVKVESQSLEIKYDAPTINKLATCFEQDTQRNLQGVKQAAYSTYTDVKNRSYILMKHNVEKIKRLDVDIDLQSSYFLLPQNGVYQDGGPSICMDFGHFTLKRDTKLGQNGEGSDSLNAPKDLAEARERSYTQFKLKIEDVQLIYAGQGESWETARKNRNTRLHLINPMELELDLGKCIYSDDAVLPAWKVAGTIPNIDLRLSDKRLHRLMDHIQSIPFPESKNPAIEASAVESDTISTQGLLSNTEQTLQAVEGMTPVLKTKEKADAEDNGTKEPEAEKKPESENQLTQLEATFKLDKVDLHIDEATNDDNVDKGFLRLTLETIVATTVMKTFDMKFNASLSDMIVFHEQFIGKDEQGLRLLSAQYIEQEGEEIRKLVSMNFLHTSRENPLFSSSPYDGIENKVDVNFSKLVVTLQLEALLSIFKFQDSLLKQLPKDSPEDQAKKKQEEEEKKAQEQKNTDENKKIVKKNDVPASPSLQIQAGLEEFRIILATKQARIFDIQVQGINANVSQAPDKTLVKLTLSDLRVFDPYKDARYRKIISQKGDGKELLSVDLSLFTYPENYEKPIDVYDCDVKVEFAKANIVFLFKHIGALLGFLDSLNITKAALAAASTQAESALEQAKKLQEQAFKVHLDITFRAPNIIIPTNSHSDEALFLDLGELTLKTTFNDDPVKSLVEQQTIRLENILASRARLDQDYNILGEAILLDCAELNTSIGRLLFPQRAKSEPAVSIKVEWDSVHFYLAKDDYSSVMKVLLENFAENITDQITDVDQLEQYHYRQEEQEKEEEILKNAAIEKQKASIGTEVLQTLKLRAKINKLALTLYLGESDMTVRRGPRNDNLKLANVQIEMFDTVFSQKSDGSYKATARVKNFLLDDLRSSNQTDSVTRMMDRHFTVDPDAQMLIASFEFEPKKESSSALRDLTAQLESLYICISLDYLMTLQDFFVSGLPSTENQTKPKLEQSATTTDENRLKPERQVSSAPSKISTAPTKAPQPPNADADVETRLKVMIKNPEIILLEDQHNANSNCLVLDLAMETRINIVNNETRIYGWLKDLTVYSSNFAELRNSKGSESKIKYRILQPAKVDLFISMDAQSQKIDVRISDIIVSIAPAAIRTMIGVTSSLGTLQSATKDEREKINSKSLFDPKFFKDANFWFTKDFEDKVEETDILETVRGAPSQQKAIKEEENKIKEKEEEIQKPLAQRLFFLLETLELKLEVGLGSVTKSVVAMCLSNITADIQNWSSEMSLSSAVNIEAALFNEHMLTWEPLIEPAIDSSGTLLSPWGITCSISPALPFIDSAGPASGKEHDRKDGVASSGAKQLILVRADQLLNITITKSGLDLVQRLSALFNDVYNKRLPPSADDDLPMLSLFNGTGQELSIGQLDGLQFADNPAMPAVTLDPNQSVPLKIPDEHQITGRLSVIEDQSFKKRQEFNVKIGEASKTVSISRTWKRVYELGRSQNPNWPIQMLCDAQIKNNRRRIVLSSIVRVFNNTTLPLLILNDDSVNSNIRTTVAKIDINQDFYIPLDLLYKHASSPIFFALDENNEGDNFFSFDWEKDFSRDTKLKLKNGNDAHFVVFKEITEAYSENTDQLGHATFSLHVHPALHLTNLLPVDIQCSIDNLESIDFKPSQLQLITSGNKQSSLVFTILSYDNVKWISEPVNLKAEGKGDHNEHPVILRKADAGNSSQVLRMILRVDAYHESYRLSLYSPFWVLNRTDLKLEFQIEANRTMVDVTETPYLLCPEKFDSEASKKGQIRVFSPEQNETAASWSEKFSLDVIKSTGMTSCKVANDRTYMICVDIVTSSFGLTKLVTLSPSMVITNKSSIGIEIVETVADKEQDKWKSLNPEQLIPFWPRNIKDGLMRVRYLDNQIASTPFLTNQKHRTLLRMEDEERPAIYVEVTATDFDGVRVIFGDYKIGDAPLLIVNCLRKDPVSFCQVDNVKSQLLPPLNYVYYTWVDPLKARELVASCGTKTTKLNLAPQCGSFGQDGDHNVTYTIFIDGVQTVLLFSDDLKVIESASGMPSLVESLGQCIQMGIHDIGISIVNDLTREELLYISLNKSKVVWTETKKSRAKPISVDLNTQLEEIYQTHLEEREVDPTNKQLLTKKYHSKDYKEILFNGNIADVISAKNSHKILKRQALDGLWIEYAWSVTNSTIHIRLNRVQIDNQLDYTIFPVMFHPVIPKITGNEHAEKPLIELSIFQSKTARSNIIQFKYFKLLIQEFAVKIDQGLIVALLAFLRLESNSGAPTVNMDADLEQIKKPLVEIIKAQIDTPTGETEMFFDNIHLSPLKIHVSFSMHGAKPTEELLAEYPLVGFLLQTLNVAEVQDVILRLGYYERNHDKFTITKITNEVSSHYQNQFMKQLHVLVFGLDVLGNPFGVIRGIAEGVESFFYEPYKGAIEGPMEFAEGVATGVKSLFGSAVGGAAGAFSKITGVLGKGLATLSFDEDYKASRIRRKEPGANAATDIAVGGKNVVMGFVDGVTGVVTKPISGAKKDGASGFIKGLGKGFIGLVTRPTGGIVDFASTSLDLVKRTAQQEEIVRRVRYPRHVGRDGLVRPYVAHEAMGFFILNRLEEGKYAKSDTYVAHITCLESPPSWLMATSKRVLFVTEISFLGMYEIDWEIPYEELREAPMVKANTNQIQILTKEVKKSGTMKSQRTYGKLIKYRTATDAKYIVDKIDGAMHVAGV